MWMGYENMYTYYFLRSLVNACSHTTCFWYTEGGHFVPLLLIQTISGSLLKQLFILIILQGCVGLQSPLITPCLEFSFVASENDTLLKSPVSHNSSTISTQHLKICIEINLMWADVVGRNSLHWYFESLLFWSYRKRCFHIFLLLDTSDEEVKKRAISKNKFR